MAGKNMSEVAPMTKADNTNMVTMALKIFEYTSINLKDDKQIHERITDYFSECQKLGLRPGNMGLYSALGLSRQEVHNILSGRDRNKVSPAGCDMIKKALRAMSTYREILGSTGKINPVTLIFWQKNFDGLQDSTSLELSTRPSDAYTDGFQSMTPDEIQKQIEADIPIDSEAEIIST